MSQKLRPPTRHQAEALAWAKGRDRIALFMQMRLGKTLVVVRWAERAAPAEPILVVAPLTTLPGWAEELDLEGLRSVQLVGPQATRTSLAHEAASGGVRWFLTNYEGVRRGGQRRPDGRPRPTAAPVLASLPWGAIVADESTYLRNPQAQVTRVLTNFAEKVGVQRRAILSGLPAPQGPEDYFSQMRFLHGEFMGQDNFWKWRDLYFESDYMGYAWTPKHGAKQKIQVALADKAFVMTRKEAGMGNKRIKEKRWVTLSQKTRAAYDKAEHEFAFGSAETKYAVVARNWMSQLCGGYPIADRTHDHHQKTRALLELLEGELKEEKVVVWFAYRRELENVYKSLVSRDIPCRQIHGDVDPHKRLGKIGHWRRGAGNQTLLIMIPCGRMGLNLSASSTNIYFSLTDNPEDYYQSMERIEHMEKNEPLLHVHLLAKDTIDEDRYTVLQEKGLTAKSYLKKVYDLAHERQTKRGTDG